MSDTNLLNSIPAFRHVILHFDRIENSNNKQQQRRIESLFKYCDRCVLHVKSVKEHYSYHHPLNSTTDDEENNHEDFKRNNSHQTNGKPLKKKRENLK